jgi:hypothetical protein
MTAASPAHPFLNIYDYYLFLTAIGLTPGGSSTVHIYTHKQYTEYRERNARNDIKKKKIGSAGHVPSLRVIPWHLPYK